MPTPYELSEQDFAFNGTLDPDMILERMGFLPRSIYREGNLLRVHCPIHKDLVRKSLILDATEKTYKCQYAKCPAYSGGLLLELVAMYYQCDITEVPERLFSDSKGQGDLAFRGEMMINQGKPQEALSYFRQACQKNPRDEITRCKLAALCLELGLKDEAYKEYLSAAESYAVRGELEKTLSIYNILIMLQPGAVKARRQLALLFSRLGRPDAAVDQLKWVIDFFCQNGQMNEAAEACEQLLEVDTGNGMAHLILGRLHDQNAKRMEALHEYEEAGRLFVEQGRRDEALNAIEEGLKVAPGSPRLRELKTRAQTLASPGKAQTDMPDTAAAEEAFLSWIEDLEAKVDEAPEKRAPPPQAATASPPPPPPNAAASAASIVSLPPAAPSPLRMPPSVSAPPVAPARAAARGQVTPPAAAPAALRATPSPAAPPARPVESPPLRAVPPVPVAHPTVPIRQAPVLPPAGSPPSKSPSAAPLESTSTPRPNETASAEFDAGLGGKAIPLPPPESSRTLPARPRTPAKKIPTTAPGEVILPQTPPAPRVPAPAPPPPAPAPVPISSRLAPPAPIPAAPPRPAAPPAAAPPRARARSLHDTVEIPPEDHRVALCLKDLQGLPRDQVERMREQIIMMFNDVRRTYEEGLISDWEMRSIKEFYKAFNVAVEQYLRGGAGSDPASMTPK